MRRQWRVMLGVMSVLMALVVVVPTASAAPVSRFSAQGISAGLTSAQISTLQSTVDRYIAISGGQQTSLNTVGLPGAQYAVTLPGEAHPRNLAGADAVASGVCDGGTAPGYFCAYKYTNGRGDQLAMYRCDTYPLPGWTGLGSWGDNQTTGTISAFEDKTRTIVGTVRAKANNQSFNWTPIWYISAC